MKRIFIVILVLFFKSNIAQVTVTGANALSNGTYPTLSGAFSAINMQNQTGNTILITITADITGDDASNPGLNQGSWTSLTINPLGARTFSTQQSWSLIAINGADNVTIDGLNDGVNSLTITNPSTSNGANTIKIYNDAVNVTIKNCTLLGSAGGNAADIQPTSNVSGGTIFIGASSTTGSSNILISSNNIGPAGSNLPSCAIRGYNSTISSAASNNSITISGNNIYDYFNSGTYSSAGISVGKYNTTWIISDNRFYQTAARTITGSKRHSAIFLDPESLPATNTFTISGNIFGFSSSAGTGNYNITSIAPVDFIYVYAGFGAGSLTSIQNNTFSNISMTCSDPTILKTETDSPLKLISVYSGNTDIGTISKNNFGSQTTSVISYNTTNTSTSDVVGIFIDLHNDCIMNVSNNEFGGISAMNSSTGSARIFAIKASPYANTLSVPIKIQNNIIGGMVANSIQNNSTGSNSSVVGIYCQAISYSVTGNAIRNLTASGGTGVGNASSVMGICATTNSKIYSISQNTISALNNIHASAATVIAGIEFTSGGNGSYIKRNMIRSLNVLSSSGIINGINISNGHSTTPTYAINVENNMISLGMLEDGTTSITTGFAINGINEKNNSTSSAYNYPANIYFNSVLITGASVTGSNNTFAFNSDRLGSNAKNIRNNIFYNARSNSSGTGSHFAIRLYNVSGLTINYNDYQVTGTGGAIGRINATNYSTFAAWQGATTQDANSITPFSPLFISNNDLHLQSTGNNALNAGITIAGITTDIDPDLRATPTIGADELPIILPITLVSFDANCNGNNTLITWSTSSEDNNKNFNIQRSHDGINFVTIGTVNGAGNSFITVNYNYIDIEENNQITYYRLKQTNFDGQSEISNIVSTNPCNGNNSGETRFLIFPNPATNNITISINENLQDSGVVEITNYLGQKILEQFITIETKNIHILLDDQIANGVYFIIIKNKDEILHKQKIIKT